MRNVKCGMVDYADEELFIVEFNIHNSKFKTPTDCVGMARCHTLLRVTNLLINKTMNRILSTILISLLCLCGAMAQPAAVKNVAKSVFALKAYDAEASR